MIQEDVILDPCLGVSEAEPCDNVIEGNYLSEDRPLPSGTSISIDVASFDLSRFKKEKEHSIYISSSYINTTLESSCLAAF